MAATSQISVRKLQLEVLNDFFKRLRMTALMSAKETNLSYRGCENITCWVNQDLAVFWAVSKVVNSPELTGVVTEQSPDASCAAFGRINELLGLLLQNVRTLLCSGTRVAYGERADEPSLWNRIGERRILYQQGSAGKDVYKQRFEEVALEIHKFIDFVQNDDLVTAFLVNEGVQGAR